MTKDEIIKRNLDLHGEWMKYVFEHPEVEVLDRITKGSVLVILPEDDEALYDENYKVLEENEMGTCICCNNENTKTSDFKC